MKFIYTILILFFGIVQLRGQRDSLSVYFFLAPNCTICQYYIPTIDNLHKTYSKDYHFVGIFPNKNTSSADIESFKETTGLTFEMRLDHQKEISNTLQATHTPQVIVYNHSINKIIYKGRIDDLYIALGRRKPSITDYSLQNFLESYPSYPQDTLIENKTIGCLINYVDNEN